MSIAIHRNKASELKLAEPLRQGFLDAMLKIRHGQEAEICSCCISNNRVREKTEKEFNSAPLRSQAKSTESPPNETSPILATT